MEMTKLAEIAESAESECQAETEPRFVRLKIPPDQRVFIESLSKERRLKFHEVVYELIRDRIKQLANSPESSQLLVEAQSPENEDSEMKRIEAHLVEIKEVLQSSGNYNASDTREPDRSTSPNDAETTEEDEEGNLARLLTAILQGHLQPPLHRLIAQIETFQNEVRDANHVMCDRNQTSDQDELDRWFVIKGELEVLREMLSRVALAATAPEHRAEFAEYIAYVTERFGQLESRLPPLPNYFLPSTDDD